MFLGKPLLYIIDATALIFRSYYASREYLLNSKQQDVSAINGTITSISSFLNSINPDYVAVVFDPAGGSFRNDIFSAYKANRNEVDAQLINQIEPLINLCQALGLKTFCVPGYEADDTIGTLAKQFGAQGFDVVIETRDKDFIQLIDDNISIVDTPNNTLYDKKNGHLKFGVPIQYTIDFLAICGDKADNIPGIKSFGPEAAKNLINQYGAIKDIYSHLDNGTLTEGIKGKRLETVLKTLKEYRDDAFLSFDLARIHTQVPLEPVVSKEDLLIKPANAQVIASITQEFELGRVRNNILRGNYNFLADKELTAHEVGDLVAQLPALPARDPVRVAKGSVNAPVSQQASNRPARKKVETVDYIVTPEDIALLAATSKFPGTHQNYSATTTQSELLNYADFVAYCNGSKEVTNQAVVASQALIQPLVQRLLTNPSEYFRNLTASKTAKSKSSPKKSKANSNGIAELNLDASAIMQQLKLQVSEATASSTPEQLLSDLVTTLVEQTQATHQALKNSSLPQATVNNQVTNDILARALTNLVAFTQALLDTKVQLEPLLATSLTVNLYNYLQQYSKQAVTFGVGLLYGKQVDRQLQAKLNQEQGVSASATNNTVTAVANEVTGEVTGEVADTSGVSEANVAEQLQTHELQAHCFILDQSDEQWQEILGTTAGYYAWQTAVNELVIKPLLTQRPADLNDLPTVGASTEQENSGTDTGISSSEGSSISTSETTDNSTVASLQQPQANSHPNLPRLFLDNDLVTKNVAALDLSQFQGQVVVHNLRELLHHFDYSVAQVLQVADNVHCLELLSYCRNSNCKGHTPYHIASNYFDVAIDNIDNYSKTKADFMLLGRQAQQQLRFMTYASFYFLFQGLPSFYRIERPLFKYLYAMEVAGIMVNLEKLQTIKQQLDQEIAQVEAQILELAGQEFNPKSSKQTAEILYDVLGLPEQANRSTSAEAISSLDHPIIEKILSYRSLTTIVGTHVEPLIELSLPLHNDAGRKVFTNFSQTQAVTGRLSSYNPNLQNVPSRGSIAHELRSCFIAPPGYSIVSFDYSQIELRVSAYFSNEDNMIEAFAQGADIHSQTAAKIFKKEISELEPENRQFAKAINFGLNYGKTAFSLANELNISRTEAKEFIEDYFNAFPKIREYIANTINKAKATAFVTTFAKRVIPLPNIQSKIFAAVDADKRNATNYPIQGSAAEIMKLAMVHLLPHLATDLAYAIPHLQIHDELVFSIPDHLLEDYIPRIKAVMEGVVNLTTLKLKVDHSVGKHWKK